MDENLLRQVEKETFDSLSFPKKILNLFLLYCRTIRTETDRLKKNFFGFPRYAQHHRLL